MILEVHDHTDARDSAPCLVLRRRIGDTLEAWESGAGFRVLDTRLSKHAESAMWGVSDAKCSRDDVVMTAGLPRLILGRCCACACAYGRPHAAHARAAVFITRSNVRAHVLPSADGQQDIYTDADDRRLAGRGRRNRVAKTVGNTEAETDWVRKTVTPRHSG